MRKISTNIQSSNKETVMKKQFFLCCIAFVAIAPFCFGQDSLAKSGKSAANDTTITNLEKSAWEAFKNKQSDPFKALLSKDFYAVYADGIKNLDAEVAEMAKTDLGDYSFADVKVVFPHPKVAVITYKATQHSTSSGQDMSGTYNCGSVWVQQGGKWLGALHTEAKVQ
jgi:Domain of unknown function (DUF4440)